TQPPPTPTLFPYTTLFRSGIRHQRADRRHIETVRNIEYFKRGIEVHTLAQWDIPADANVIENGPGSDPGITAQIAIERKQGWRNPSRKLVCQQAIDARFLKH